MIDIPNHAKLAFKVPNGHFTVLEMIKDEGKLIMDKNTNNKNKTEDQKNDIIPDVSEDFSFVTMETEEKTIKKIRDKNNKAKKGEVSREDFLASLGQ